MPPHSIRDEPHLASFHGSTGSSSSSGGLILLMENRSNEGNYRPMVHQNNTRSSIESVFSSVCSLSTMDIEAEMIDSDKYLASSMISRGKYIILLYNLFNCTNKIKKLLIIKTIQEL